MEKFAKRKEIITELIANHLLINGLKDSSLRYLAKKINTSDRMLLHYFNNKEDLMTESLNLIVKRLVILLNKSKPKKMNFNEFVDYLAIMRNDKQMHYFMRLGLELANKSVLKEEYYCRISRQIINNIYTWVHNSLDVENENLKKSTASLIITIMEGFVFLDAVNSDEIIVNALESISNIQYKSSKLER